MQKHLIYHIQNVSSKTACRRTGIAWFTTLQWRHNERHDVSNHQGLDCLLNRLLQRWKKSVCLEERYDGWVCGWNYLSMYFYRTFGGNGRLCIIHACGSFYLSYFYFLLTVYLYGNKICHFDKSHRDSWNECAIYSNIQPEDDGKSKVII